MTERKYSAKYFGATNQGMVRTNNEDTYICQKIWDESHILCAAIDGLGGYEGGEIAAELARTTIIKHLEDFASKKTGELLKASFIAANNEIIRQHEARPKVSQMGCVASVGIIDLLQGVISIAHVGDSRIYQFVNGELKKLTHDHSLVGYREETGELSEEAAMNHPKRNVIDKFLGEQHLNFDSESYVEVSVWPITGDTQYLFCSDGLTDLVTSREITEILISKVSIDSKVHQLITKANDAGGKDNITVVIADITFSKKYNDIKSFEEPVPGDNEKNREKASKSFFPSLRNFLLGLVIGVGATVAYNFYESRFSNTSDRPALDKLMKVNDQFANRIQELEDSIVKLTRLSMEKSNEENSDTVDSVNQRYDEESPEEN